MRSAMTGTPLGPPRSCAYKPTAYATPAPLIPSAVRSIWSRVSVFW
ncbi:Uncharacterised protein [Mycobacterium tuberculosis]|uniref:Uncharacterized protein n=1 Tax=Mycobacterium tuberculosis TaxID=1773 RepID=A0A916PHG1_MYCTX|nr:Uncharacterised protein [Mycobacterium tuberculosis]CPA78618.1 Uncharacterised protein [Mycobacterium tuberculosis]